MLEHSREENQEMETTDQEKDMLTNNTCQRDDFLISREKAKEEKEWKLQVCSGFY
jgi:hypothetical protein